MIAHYYEGVQQPIAAFADSEKAGFKRSFGTGLFK
jgi:hypothetical protein